MRLTIALLKRKMPNGNIWIGKNRLGHYVYAQNIERFVKRLQIEENNMLLLRHPYLTLKQEQQADKALNKYEENLLARKIEKASSRTKPSKRIEDNFQKLLVTEKWDV